MTFEEILDCFEGPARHAGKSVIKRCPAHPDRTPSLSLSEGEDERTLLNCLAGCDTEEVLAAVGLSTSDLFTNSSPAIEGAWVSSSEDDEIRYPYLHGDGSVAYVIVRRSGKKFQADRRVPAEDRILYNLPSVSAEEEAVYVCEGEKDATTLIDAGLAATTAPFGAESAWLAQYTPQLAHVKKVVVVADNDQPGYRRAARVAAALTDAGLTVETLRPPEVFKDVTDVYNAGLTVDSLERFDPENELTTEDDGGLTPVDIRALMSGDPPEKEWLAEPLLPARKQVGLVARRGDGKSLLALDIAARKAAGRRCLETDAQEPIHVLYLDMEMGPDDLWERLHNLGWTPDHEAFDDLESYLHYYQLPKLQPLDTAEGGQALEELIDKHDAVLVVIDTLSRVVEGEENASETFRDLFRHTESRLKKKNITLLRLDHLGKDSSKGSRGSSSKEDPLDVIWNLARKDAAPVGESFTTQLELTLSKGRSVGYPAAITVNVDQDDYGTLTHRVPQQFVGADVRGLIEQLDQLRIPVDWGYHKVAKLARKEGVTGKNNNFREAVKYRKRQRATGGAASEEDGPPYDNEEEGNDEVQPLDGHCPDCGMVRRHSSVCANREKR